MFKRSDTTRHNRSGRFTFETMERRELMTANLGMAIEPIESPVAAVASPAISAPFELTYVNNDTMAGATPMGTVSTSVTSRGSIGGTDAVDFWKFRVANSGQTTIELAGMSRDVDIEILDSRGNILGRGTRGGTLTESVTVNLLSGQDYFIKIYPYTPPTWLTVGSGPVSSYQLSVNAPALVDPDPGVRPIGTVATSYSYNGTIGEADPVDWFKFRVANSGATTIRLAGMSRDVDINIVDSSGRVLASGTNGGASSESLTVNLQAGVDYFIKVYPYGSGPVTNYQLSVTAPSILFNPFDDTMATANQLGTITNTTQTAVNRVSASDRVDYFSFTPGPSRTGLRSVNITLTGSSAGLALELIDSNGIVVSRPRPTSTNSISLNQNLIAGQQYFIRVYPRNSVTINYQLSVTA